MEEIFAVPGVVKCGVISGCGVFIDESSLYLVTLFGSLLVPASFSGKLLQLRVFFRSSADYIIGPLHVKLRVAVSQMPSISQLCNWIQKGKKV